MIPKTMMILYLEVVPHIERVMNMGDIKALWPTLKKQRTEQLLFNR